MRGYLKQFLHTLSARSLDAYLITHDTDIRYLIKFPAAESWLLVTPRKTFYLTDARYTLDAREHLRDITVVDTKGERTSTLFCLLKKSGAETMGFDARHLSVAQFRLLQKQRPSTVRLVRADSLIEHQRVIKSSAEISCIRAALALHKKALGYLNRILRPGKTERDVALQLEQFLKSRGAEFSFPPIVASGRHSCYPHAAVTDRKIRQRDVVLVDTGVDIQGYKSDLTRMFFFGKIPPLVQDVVTKVHAAQQRAIRLIRSGIPVAAVDQEARKYLQQFNLAKYFVHSLGHGVGLDIHEAPRLSQKSNEILEAGMVITVEPAVYLPNDFGVRVEDMVLVTKQGCEILSRDIKI